MRIMDDLMYALDGLSARLPASTQQESAIAIAEAALTQRGRMALRSAQLCGLLQITLQRWWRPRGACIQYCLCSGCQAAGVQCAWCVVSTPVSVLWYTGQRARSATC